MYEPLVSIIIPVYNGSRYVREAIDSALAQTYKNREIIVVNDGSSDGGATDEVIRSYGDKIRYYIKENGGVSSALNKGIQEMSGEYFSWLSHDDVYEADKIEKQVAVLDKVGKDTLIYCNYTLINEFSQPLSHRAPKHDFDTDKLICAQDVMRGLLTGAAFNGCCLLIPKEALIKNGFFDERLRFCQDAFMWYKIFMSDHSLYCIEAASVKNRVHAQQLTQTGQALFRKECHMISEMLTERFAEISTKETNFLKMYLLSDAKHFKAERVKAILETGKKYQLVSTSTVVKAYLLCAYGKVRPWIRKLYYKIFRKIKTSC